jgi:hypothetical protein
MGKYNALIIKIFTKSKLFTNPMALKLMIINRKQKFKLFNI